MSHRNYPATREVLDSITYKDWHFESFAPVDMSYFSATFRVCFPAPCSRTGVDAMQFGPWLSIPFCLDEDGILKLVLNAIHRAEEHETREFFKYQGRVVFDPHQRVV